MDGYGAYAEMLRGAVAQQAVKQREAMDAFQGKLADTERLKSIIETSTEGVGAAFSTPALGQGVKAISKVIAGKVVKRIEDKLRPKPIEPEPTEEDIAQSTRTQAAEDLGGAGERNFVESGEELQQMGELPEQIEAQEESSRPVGEGEGSSETANASGDAEQAAQSATEATAEGASSTAAEGGLEAGAAAATELETGATATEIGLDATLLADPLTALFGLILGGVIAAAGIGGADSVKNPSVPKTPTIANVSTQFGIGNNGS
jgi:hypothetical protein